MSKKETTETKTTISPDGKKTTTTTTTTTYYSSSSSSSGGGGGNSEEGHHKLFDFKNLFGKDSPFSEDFFKKFMEDALPSHGEIKKVKYEKKEDKSDLPEDFNLFIKPSEKVDYKTSDCTGNKKAVLIGINYYNTDFQLRGCINDVNNIKEFVKSHYGFEESNMKILTDDQLDPELLPTRENIIKAIKWLINDPKPNDSYFFHYSGHGGQVKDDAGDEDDGFDETIMPVDFMTKGQIIDDELHALMVQPLSPGVKLTVIFDCCHSGTVLDLPYVYSTRGVIKEPSILSLGASDSQRLRRKNIETKGSPADIIMFSGCKDTQTSADAQEAGKATGAMSYALIKSLKENANPTYQELLVSIRDILKSKYAQKPQLSASHEMDMHERFIM